MDIPRRADAAVKGLLLWVGVGMATLVVALAGLGFLIAGFFLWLHQTRSNAVAAAITGALLLILAALIGAAGIYVLNQIRKRQPTLMQEIGGFAGMAGAAVRLVSLVIRQDPRKALIMALLAGAIAEYFTGADKPGADKPGANKQRD